VSAAHKPGRLCMTRAAKRSNRLSSRRVLLVAPILAVAIVGAMLYAIITSPQGIAMNSHTYLSMAVVDRSNYVRYVIPDKAIGMPGGYMSTMKYLTDGVNGNYPLFTQPSLCGNVTGTGDLCLLNIKSRVVRSYTLGDFFDVWGVPLGPNETLSPRYLANDTYSWTMCVSTRGNQYVAIDDWGNHVLAVGEVILLTYSTLGCG